MQETIYFLSPPSILPPTVLPSRINSLSQHFFEKLIRYYQEEHNLMSEWMRNTKIESCATMQQTIYFLSPPSILPPTVLPSRKNSLSQHFFEKLIRYYQEEHNLMSEWMRNTKIESCATMQETIYFLSPPSILPPTVLPSRINSLSQHFIEKLIRYYQEEHHLMSESLKSKTLQETISPPSIWYYQKNSLKNTKKNTILWANEWETLKSTGVQHCRRPSAFYRHHPFGPQQYYLREKIRWVSIFSKN